MTALMGNASGNAAEHARFYQQATEETMALLRWIRQFAAAMGERRGQRRTPCLSSTVAATRKASAQVAPARAPPAEGRTRIVCKVAVAVKVVARSVPPRRGT
ncbi:MAG: hypothetical protein M5R38_16540 [Candidatus Methylomirabilis sp.]|nr:hypothetical protein [Candidatus Methylomirabilis sp.]